MTTPVSDAVTIRVEVVEVDVDVAATVLDVDVDATLVVAVAVVVVAIVDVNFVACFTVSFPYRFSRTFFFSSSAMQFVQTCFGFNTRLARHGCKKYAESLTDNM